MDDDKGKERKGYFHEYDKKRRAEHAERSKKKEQRRKQNKVHVMQIIVSL